MTIPCRNDHSRSKGSSCRSRTWLVITRCGAGSRVFCRVSQCFSGGIETINGFVGLTAGIVRSCRYPFACSAARGLRLVRGMVDFLERTDSPSALSPLAQLSRLFLCSCGARQAVGGLFRVNAFWRDRCDQWDNSRGPPLLTLSLKVKRNSAHSQRSRSWSPRSPGLNARGCSTSGLTSALPVLAQGHRAREACRACLNRRPQSGRHPLRRTAFADDFIDVIAVDALKHAQLEANARGLDTCQDHWTQTFRTGMGLNCHAACVEQDCWGWHDAHLNSGRSVTELSFTEGAVSGRWWSHHGIIAIDTPSHFAHFQS